MALVALMTFKYYCLLLFFLNVFLHAYSISFEVDQKHSCLLCDIQITDNVNQDESKVFCENLNQQIDFILFLHQILTQEDWNIVLFLGMERTSHWAALYFVALMTFGNYVLFNLLVAILVEGFSNQVSPCLLAFFQKDIFLVTERNFFDLILF